MKFQFNINVNEQDYLDYNNFMVIRSHYGKKHMFIYRISIAIIIAGFIMVVLISDEFSLESIISVIPMVILLALCQVFLKKFLEWSLKTHIKTLKEKGRMPFSSEAVMEFYEDSFVETTTYSKTENKYTMIERISVVDNKMIYIHVNNVMSYMLPLSSFMSKEQYDSFFDFIKTKCPNIDIY